MKDKKKIIIISAAAVLGILIVVLTISLAKTKNNLKESEKQNEEIQELIALEQEEMLNDLQNAQIEYEELKSKILSNDSLLIKLEQEQLRTQQLYEELQNTKATNAAEIKRLKKELKTLRAVLEDYMVQIDSLYRENAVLKDENTKLIAGKQKVEKERNDLAKEKKALSEKVDLAAQLDATDVAIAMLRSNGKTTSKVKNAKQISVSCTISKNITASTGDKIVYVRIMQPDGEPLTKGYSNTFKYQNRDISYSMNKSFEFSGEEQSLTLYWNIEETLQQGRYRAYIFVDGNIIGEGYADFE
jgi:predicted  nucleic acid-binding Zn-ribbon protein